VVEHVSVCHKAVCLYSLNLNAENTARNHHTDFWVLSERELSKIWNFLANEIVVCFNIYYFLFNLVKERTAFEHFLFFIGEENGEVGVALWQYIYVNVPFRVRFASLLHHKSAQKWMLRWDKSLSKSLVKHFLANWRCESHFKSYNLFLRNEQYGLSLLDIACCVHSTIVSSVVPNL